MQGVRIEMEIVVGEHQFIAEVSQDCPSSFCITVNKKHMGYIVHYSTGWQWCPSSSKVNLYSDDIFIILDILRANFPDLPNLQSADHFCDYLLPKYKSWPRK